MKILQDDVRNVCDVLQQEKFHIYFFGSTVRKWLLNEIPEVYYILTDADIVELAQLFDNIEFPGKGDFDAEIKTDHSTLRFRKCSPPHGEINIQYLQEISEAQILTIDTFFYTLQKGQYIDPFSRLDDIEKKLIIPMARFREMNQQDPSRIFDPLKLVCKFGFIVTGEMEEELRHYSFRFNPEYLQDIRTGFNDVITSSHPYAVISLMDKLKIIRGIFPELENTQSVPQDKEHHPEGNVYEHTLECFKYLEKPSLELALASLLHDVGKPATLRILRNKLSFPNHQKVGAGIARRILRKLGYEEGLIASVSYLVEHHLLSHEFHNINENRKKEFMEHPLFPDLLKLFKADVMSCYGDLTDYHRISSFYRKSLPRIM